MDIRALSTLDECREVAALERAIWEYTVAEEQVPPAVMRISINRGGILIGGFDAAGVLQGFVYSTPGLKDGAPMQWSHMLGVARGGPRSRAGQAAEARAA